MIKIFANCKIFGYTYNYSEAIINKSFNALIINKIYKYYYYKNL